MTVSGWRRQTTPGRRRPRSDILRVAGLGVLYFLLAWGSLRLFATFNASVSPLWPPTGLAVGALLVWGRRLWPGITAGAFAANLATTGDVPSSALIAVGNTLEAVLAVWAVRRFVGTQDPFSSLPALARLAAILLVAPVASATVGAGSLAALGLATWQDASTVWVIWWIGDAVGALVFAPVLVLWATRAETGWRSPRRTEWGLALLATTLSAGAVFGADLLFGSSNLPIELLVAPAIVWIAYRFWPRDTATALLVITTVATVATLAGSGPFGGRGGPEGMVLLAVFEVTGAIMAMVLAVLVVERRDAAAGLELRVRERTEAMQKVVEDLKRSREQLAEAQKIARVGSWRLDVEDDHVVWTDELYDLFGVDPKRFRADFAAFLDLVHPDDRERVGARIQKAGQDGRGYEHEYRVVRPDGETRWVHGRGMVDRDPDGRVVRLHGTVQDITERKVAETQLSILVDSAPDAILVVDKGGRIVSTNQRVQEVFGYTREEAEGRPLEDLLPQRFREAHRGHRRRYSEDPQVRSMGVGLELKALRKDGTEFPVEVSLSPIETEQGLQVVAIVRDVTEREKVAEADRVAFARLVEIEKLREVDRFKTQVLNTASHELNTPITPLKMQLYLLKGALGELNDEQRKAVEVLDRNVNRLAELVGDILDVARLQGGSLKLVPARTDVRHLAEEAVETFEEPAREAGVGLTLSGEGDTETVADAKRISQVFYNLLSNALKFSPPGGRIRIVVDSDGKEIRAHVQDDGPGLDEEQIKRLFQPFSQVHERTPDAPAGTGLGLYICKGILLQHKGQIGVESGGHGHGSTFWFRMPIVRGEEGPVEEAGEEE